MARPHKITGLKKHRNERLKLDFRSGKTGTELAVKYGITRARVYQILSGKKRVNSER